MVVALSPQACVAAVAQHDHGRNHDGGRHAGPHGGSGSCSRSAPSASSRAVPGFVQLVGSAADGTVFFVGSIFFTSAALLSISRLPTPIVSPAAVAGACASSPSSPIESTGGRPDPARRHCLLQHQHLPGDAAEFRHLASRPARLGARGGRLDLLPDLRPARLSRGPQWRHLLGQRTLEWKISTVNFAGCVLFGISASPATWFRRQAISSTLPPPT